MADGVVSIDTNLLVYAQNSRCPQHEPARAFVTHCQDREIVICELVLVELYLVLRSAAIVSRPLGATEAAEVCTRYRGNPRWRLVENAPVMSAVWQRAASRVRAPQDHRYAVGPDVTPPRGHRVCHGEYSPLRKARVRAGVESRGPLAATGRSRGSGV